MIISPTQGALAAIGRSARRIQKRARAEGDYWTSGLASEILDEIAFIELRAIHGNYPPHPRWKVVRSRIELALSKAIIGIEAGWRRLCNRLDAHPLVVLFLLVCCGGVAVLLAKMLRHMAFGIW